MKNHSRGFVALVSTIVISAVLITLMFVLGAATFYARFDSLGSESKRVSSGLAESCANVALLQLSLSNNPSHFSLTNDIVSVGEDLRGDEMMCTIKNITHAGNIATIDSYASYNNSYSTVVVNALVSDPSIAPNPQSLVQHVSIISWQETP